jgi:hypothetical protein
MARDDADRLGDITVAAARKEDHVRDIAAVTQLPEAVVLRWLEDAGLHGM